MRIEKKWQETFVHAYIKAIRNRKPHLKTSVGENYNLYLKIHA